MDSASTNISAQFSLSNCPPSRIKALRAYQAYRDELEREVYRFANYKCSILPDLRKRADCLLTLIRRESIDLEEAEIRFGQLQVGYMEAML